MAYYLQLNSNDYSMYVNMLKVANQHNYKSMTTAAGNTLVKYINSKRSIEVGIIPLDAAVMSRLMIDIGKLEVTVTYRDPATNALESFKGIIPQNIVEYYTIRADKVSYKAFAFTITEL